jgi:hypothetical protein
VVAHAWVTSDKAPECVESPIRHENRTLSQPHARF